MNITFLVGNGFDMGIGAKTSYKAFYNWYCNQKSDIPHIQKFRSEINEDIDSTGENWSDLELGLGKYTTHFTPDNVNEFFDCYQDVHNGIRKYLVEETALYDTDRLSLDSIAALKDGILNFYKELFPQERNAFTQLFNDDAGNDTFVNFISFNYTGILDACLKKCADAPLKKWQHNGFTRQFVLRPDVIHAHGTTGIFPALGVNDESQIHNKALLDVPNFSDIMIKPNNINAVGQLWHIEAETLIDKSRIVCVYGMSLGASDAKWWKKIVSWLSGQANRHLIIFWYSKDPPNGIDSLKQLSQQRAVKELITSYSNLTPEKFKTISSRIHVIINTENVLRVTIPLQDEESCALSAP